MRDLQVALAKLGRSRAAVSSVVAALRDGTSSVHSVRAVLGSGLSVEGCVRAQGQLKPGKVGARLYSGAGHPPRWSLGVCGGGTTATVF
jgi:hypothetical protein